MDNVPDKKGKEEKGKAIRSLGSKRINKPQPNFLKYGFHSRFSECFCFFPLVLTLNEPNQVFKLWFFGPMEAIYAVYRGHIPPYKLTYFWYLRIHTSKPIPGNALEKTKQAVSRSFVG